MNIGYTKTFIAGAAVTGRRIVKFDGAGAVITAAADTDNFIGVSDSLDIANGERIDVIMGGQPKVVASAAIAAGALVSSAADGRAKTAEAGDSVIGFAVEAAGAAGDVITIHLARFKI